MNAVRTTFLLAIMTGLFMAVGFVVGGQTGMVIALGIAIVMNAISYWNADKIVLSLQHIVDRLDLGQHDVTQAVTGLTNDGSHVVGKGGMIHRMHTRRHPGARRSFAGQRSHQGCMLGLGTDRRSVFTIERHVKNAGAELFRHFSL